MRVTDGVGARTRREGDERRKEREAGLAFVHGILTFIIIHGNIECNYVQLNTRRHQSIYFL